MRILSGARKGVLVAASVGMLTLGTVSAGALSAAPAFAAAGCYAQTCDGSDPVAAGCNIGAITARQVTLDGYTVQLRYSWRCRAAWTRILGGTRRGQYYFVYNEDNQESWGRNYYGGGIVSRMVDDKGTQSHACMYINGPKYCTGYA